MEGEAAGDLAALLVLVRVVFLGGAFHSVLLLSDGLGELSAHVQMSAMKQRFRATMPGADMRRSWARIISKVFMEMSARVWMVALSFFRMPVRTQRPREISRKPMKGVAMGARSEPRMRSTMRLWRGMPLRTLLKRP